MKTTNSTCRL